MPAKANPSDKPPTALQRRIVMALKRLTAKAGYPPTQQELADALGVTQPTMHAHIASLIRKGVLSRKGNSPRSLKVVERHW